MKTTIAKPKLKAAALPAIEGKKVLTLTEELSSVGKKTLWVLNTSENSNKSGKSEVYLTIRHNNEHHGVKIDQTWLPINLAASGVPRRAMLENMSFSRAVSKKLVTIISDSYARELLDTDDAATEQRRLDEIQNEIENAGRAKGIGDVEVVNRSKEQSFDVGDINAVTQDNLGPFRAFVVKNNSIEESQAIQAIRSNGKLTREKAEYLLANTKHAKVKNWLSAALN